MVIIRNIELFILGLKKKIKKKKIMHAWHYLHLHNDAGIGKWCILMGMKNYLHLWWKEVHIRNTFDGFDHMVHEYYHLVKAFIKPHCLNINNIDGSQWIVSFSKLPTLVEDLSGVESPSYRRYLF